MFFEGSLQDGISTAVAQSKQVVCFVTDGENESRQWEDDFLTDESLKTPLNSQAIVLRLQAGSEEAGFLEALFPVPKKPTVVIIQNGQLKEYIAAGTAKDEFVRRVSAAFSQGPSESNTAVASTTQAPAQSQQGTQPQASHVPAPTVEDDESDLYGDYSPATSSQEHRAEEVQSGLAEQERRAALKKARDGKVRADREAHARRDAEEATASQSNYADAVKHRKQQANEERQRILKRIEDDKRARKGRDAEERKARQLLSANQDGEESGSQTAPIPLSRKMPKGGQGDNCNLQVRLLDGSTIRSRFPSDKTLSRDVRKWIDEERTDGDAPYSFRVVLTPLPNKAIEPTEEIESLLSLGLAPSSTLILVPVKYTSAFSQTGGVIQQGFNPIIGMFAAVYSTITASIWGIFGTLFGRRNAPEQGSIPLENLNAARNSRIRGFQNADDRQRDAQLYNGNSLNFEPRRDEDGEDIDQ
ncbi:Uu.00g119090.m01.CDS01 [Anthostomella pinea]|uniref:Uu.00g119090.m01.CDS01 n=1 Tax=Anthostomella pinea TaxID=933095 RepID=A0AAI8YH01_9PEZI|nr:Uu.00g119090.m01.CDS01 [Anthostomella pinea]